MRKHERKEKEIDRLKNGHKNLPSVFFFHHSAKLDFFFQKNWTPECHFVVKRNGETGKLVPR